MTANLTCIQVSALLSFYLDNKLSNQLTQFVEDHLDVCPTCRAKFEALKDMVNSLKEVHEKLATVTTSSEKQSVATKFDEFQANLSAYIDNELSDEENIKIKKYVISHAKAREDLEHMYNLKKLMHNSFDKAKHEIKKDYSKFVLKRIDIQEEIYSTDSFAKIVAIFIFITAVFALAAMAVFWI